MIAAGQLRMVCFATIVLVTGSRHAAAQYAADEDVRQELANLRVEVQQLRDELEALRHVVAPARPSPFVAARFDMSAAASAPAAPSQDQAPQPSLEILQTQLAELAQVKVESTSRMAVKVFGTIHSDTFANSDNPNWMDSPNLVNPRPPDGFTGSFSSTLRQTRLGFTV